MIAPALLVLAKAPQAGRVKTRLAAGIGAGQALAVYRALLARTARAIAGWPGPATLLIDGDPVLFDATELASLPRRPQGTGGLGARLAAAFASTALPAIAIGTDCPLLEPQHLHRLADRLTTADAAFGPARDGGYWGIGLAEPGVVARCCDDALPWSQATLLAETQARLAQDGRRVGLADMLDDLDDAEDLRRAEAAGFRWDAREDAA